MATDTVRKNCQGRGIPLLSAQGMYDAGKIGMDVWLWQAACA